MDKSYQGVLFDLDGTLLDTANDLGAALNYVLTKYHQPNVAKEIFRPIASDGAKGLLELGFKELLANYNYELLRDEFLTYYENNIAHHTCLYKGIDTLINALNSNNIPWGIVTNKPIGLTEILLPHYPLLMTNQVVLGGDSLAKRKPDPLPLITAAKALSVPAKKCIYVGDAPRDIEAANAANMLSIIAEWGYISDLNETKQWQANKSIAKPEEILSLLK